MPINYMEDMVNQKIPMAGYEISVALRFLCVVFAGCITDSNPSSRNLRISDTPARFPPSITTSCQTPGDIMTDENRRKRSIRPIKERWISGEELLTARTIGTVKSEIIL